MALFDKSFISIAARLFSKANHQLACLRRKSRFMNKWSLITFGLLVTF